MQTLVQIPHPSVSVLTKNSCSEWTARQGTNLCILIHIHFYFDEEICIMMLEFVSCLVVLFKSTIQVCYCGILQSTPVQSNAALDKFSVKSKFCTVPPDSHKINVYNFRPSNSNCEQTCICLTQTNILTQVFISLVLNYFRSNSSLILLQFDSAGVYFVVEFNPFK